MIRILLLGLLLSLFCGLFCVAQSNKTSSDAISTSHIRGLVVDSLEMDTIVAASVVLYRSSDSTVIKAQHTDGKGLFYLKDIQNGSYYLRVTYLGYTSLVIRIPEPFFSSKEIDLGELNLFRSEIGLAEVVVTAQLPEFVVKEDTIEYNASAFRTPEGAVVEDLLKRLPGVEVDADGTVKTTAGKTVRRVFVNGKEFFGNDPKMATRNLTVDVVDKVQVVEKQSDLAILTGVADDDPETIINITIKKGMYNGWMANVTAGAGALVENPRDEGIRYVSQSMVNRFTEEDQISIVANANNINQRASSDRGNNVRSGRGRGGSGGGGGGNGITSSNVFGVNTSNILRDNLEIGGNASYNYSDTYNDNKSFSQTFLRGGDGSEIDSTFYVRSASTERAYTNNYNLDGNVNYKPDSLTSIVFRTGFSYNSSISKSYEEQSTMGGDADSTLVNSTKSSDILESDGVGARMQLDFSRKLSKEGRSIGFSGSVDINDSNGDGTKVSENRFYTNSRDDEDIDQISTSESNRNSYNLRATYVEPVGKGNFLNFSYNIQMNENKTVNNALNYDIATGDYTLRNAKFSRTSESKTVSQNVRVDFNSNKEKYRYNVGLNIAPNYTKSKTYVDDWFDIDNDSIISDMGSRNIVNLAPSLDFTYRMGDSDIRKNIRFRYNGRTRQPTTDQLSASNNTNPLNTVYGNPDLLPTFSNNLEFEYNYNDRNTQKSLTTTWTYGFSQNDIINYVTYHEGGTRTTTYINQNGNWNMGGTLLFALPLDPKRRLKLSTHTNLSYQNSIGYSRVSNRDENNKVVQSSEKNVSKTSNLSESLNLSYMNDWFYGQVRGTIRYNNTDYSLTSMNSVNSYRYNISYNTQITLPYSVSFSSDITYTANRGLSSGYNKDETLWNAQISKSFLKGNRGSLRLQINDILRQRLSITHTESANSIQDRETTVLTSYYMLTFTYRLNSMGGRGNRDRGNRGGGGDANSSRGGGRGRF